MKRLRRVQVGKPPRGRLQLLAVEKRMGDPLSPKGCGKGIKKHLPRARERDDIRRLDPEACLLYHERRMLKKQGQP